MSTGVYAGLYRIKILANAPELLAWRPAPHRYAKKLGRSMKPDHGDAGFMGVIYSRRRFHQLHLFAIIGEEQGGGEGGWKAGVVEADAEIDLGGGAAGVGLPMEIADSIAEGLRARAGKRWV